MSHPFVPARTKRLTFTQPADLRPSPSQLRFTCGSPLAMPVPCTGAKSRHQAAAARRRLAQTCESKAAVSSRMSHICVPQGDRWTGSRQMHTFHVASGRSKTALLHALPVDIAVEVVVILAVGKFVIPCAYFTLLYFTLLCLTCSKPALLPALLCLVCLNPSLL